MLRTLTLAAILSMVASAGLASPAAADTVGGCQLSATAEFAPPLKSADQPFSYELGGELSNCVSSEVGAPADAVVTAGKPGVTIQGVTFHQPRPFGTGGCRAAAATGTLWTAWSDGTVTILDYSTTGVAAALSLTGTVAPSREVIDVDGVARTIYTTRYLDRSASAALLTHPANPMDCGGPGIATVPIDGLFAIG